VTLSVVEPPYPIATMLMSPRSIVIEDLREPTAEPDVAVIMAYCRYMDNCTVGGVLRSLIRQILENHPTAIATVMPVYKAHSARQAELMDQDALKLLVSLVRRFKRTRVVIDGLDEISEEGRVGLLRALASLPAQVLIFSRPLEPYHEHLPSLKTISFDAQMEDIQRFVTTSLGEHLGLATKLSEGKKQGLQTIASAVQEKSQGV